MPHVDIKCFPRELTDEQKTALADDITEVIIRHFNSKEGSVSVALTQVQQDDWKAQVWDREIGPVLNTLIKKPGYSL
nr:tautomerase PptA [uncultured Enterobacter sp.]